MTLNKKGKCMDREAAAAKLKKIKELAERGVGGEKETAMKMYRKLLEKYELEEEEILEDRQTKHWFGYKTEWEERLLTQIFSKVTGSQSYFVYTGQYKRRKKRGVMCTELEAAEISLLFEFYKEEYKREEEAFWLAFVSKNRIYRERTEEEKQEEQQEDKEVDEERKRMMLKASLYRDLIDGRRPPAAMIGERED